jgi:hypothetical protein
MERDYDEICYMDLKSFIKKRLAYDTASLEAAKVYINKLGFDPEEDTLIRTSFDVQTLGDLILDIITDYQTWTQQTKINQDEVSKNQSAA